NAFDVAEYLVAPFASCEHWPSRRLDIDRNDARTELPRVPGNPSDEGIHGLGVKRCQSVSRIGLEPEQFPALRRPFGPRLVVLVRAERRGHDTSVAKSVEDRLA